MPQRSKKGTQPKVAATDLAREWDYGSNPLGPESYTTGSTKKVFWVCSSCHQSYDMRINHRFYDQAKCPFCAGKRASPKYNLRTEFPKISKFFDEERNGETVENILPGSRKIFWWKCSRGHSFQNKAFRMTRHGDEHAVCRFCAGKEIWPGESLGDLFPTLCAEIDRERAGEDIDEFKISTGSIKKIPWLCNRGHRWVATVHSRARRESGCPICKQPYTKPEIRIYSELKRISDDVRLRSKIFGQEVDVMIESEGIAIEYDGAYWHKNKFDKDKKKNKNLENNGVNVFRVRQDIAVTQKQDILIRGEFNFSDMKSLLRSMLSAKTSDTFRDRIKKLLTCENWQNEKLYRQILFNLPAPIFEDSFEGRFPELTVLWDYEKNSPILPSLVSYGSNDQYWWCCASGHSFKNPVARVAGNGGSCPFCKSRRIDASNSLTRLYPKIAAEWCYTRNGDLKPSQIAPNFSKKIWWVCPEGHPYQATPNKRVNSSSGCPVCSGRLPKRGESVADLYPYLSSKIISVSGHENNRKKSSPEVIVPGSHIKLTIQCETCYIEFSRETRSFVKLIKENKPAPFSCKSCRTALVTKGRMTSPCQS
jgi:G:T-mismatch repair DNA endonuclease (very short patch repair protein)